MLIGIHAVAPRSNGGLFRYTESLLELLGESSKSDDRFLVLSDSHLEYPRGLVERKGWATASYPTTAFGLLKSLGVRAVGDGVARRVWYAGAKIRPNSAVNRPVMMPAPDSRLETFHRAQGTEVMFYPAPSDAAYRVRVPAVATVHDLNHRFYDEFPEIRAYGEYERRERFHMNVCRTAETVLVESETGKEDLLTCYPDSGIDEGRVVVLPMLPSRAATRPTSPAELEAVERRYGLPKDFLFYPAQFWPHKNHLRLIESLALLRDAHGLEPTLVLVGSHTGSLRKRTFADMMRRVVDMGLERQVLYLGHVSDQDVAALYDLSIALVMPTFFGPTNIPILEAFLRGRPVVTSDIRGLRDQSEGGAVLVDPRSPQDMAAGIQTVLTDTGRRNELVARGREVAGRYGPKEYGEILSAALSAVKDRIRSHEARIKPLVASGKR
jgi:glycosyltransferase involved in cell wall biosynthesis